MGTLHPIVTDAEELIRRLAADLTRVRDGECFCCYVARQLDEFSCDHSHRHAVRFRDFVAPRATSLLTRLKSVGACCCDCELFLNGYILHARFWIPEREEVAEDGVTIVHDAQQPEQLPLCTGVRRGSTQPCANWVRIRRW